MRKYNIGDKIRVKFDQAFGATVDAGELGLIVNYHFNDDMYYVKMDKRYYPSQDYDWIFRDEDIELVFQEEYMV
jgi:hypothetical protein